MKSIIISLILLSTFSVFGQNVIPFVDFNRFFKSFKDGFFRQVEIQEIKEFKAGDNVVGYFDIRGNLVVYDGTSKMNLSNMQVHYEVSDNLLIWKVGETLNLWDAGHKQTLSYNTGKFWLRDSIVVFEDKRFGSVNAYYEGEIFTLYASIGEMDYPDFIGENIVAFRDNGNFNKVFWRGEIFELDVWQSSYGFHGGTDMLAFNDPLTGTFAVFDNGNFIDVEEFHMPEYKVGRGFLLYENQNGDLIYYRDGEKKQLTNFGASFWEVRDDVAIWEENGITYALSNGAKVELARYRPADYKLKNGVIAFRNIMGGVSVLVDGKVHEITTQMKSEYEIFGNAVLVSLFNSSYIVFKNGKKYRT